jgi:two-component system, chemotaxis family, response regulator PixG
MNQPSGIDTEQNHLPLASDLLENIFKQLSSTRDNGCLQVVYNSVIFFIYFSEGKLIYATNSLAPFERLERQLRRLSNQNRKLTNQVIKEARSQFRNDLESYTQVSSDYQGIFWLSERDYLDPQEAVTLLRRITREVFESLLCLPDPCQYRFIHRTQQLLELCKFDLVAYMEQCQKRLLGWQAFSEHIWSSYQRLYLLEAKTTITNLNTHQNETISKLLTGLNFRQIAAIIDRDELIVCKILYPSIVNKSIILRDPKPPFDRLPKLTQDNIFEDIDDDWIITNGSDRINSQSKETQHFLEKTWKIACVDDDFDIQDRLEQLLSNNLFSILGIQDSMNAFAELIEFQPDLILLDVDLAGINGYELCTLLRNHLDFKNTPIIMLDSDRGLINLTKFTLANATDRLTKPFTQTSLFNVIFKYLQ